MWCVISKRGHGKARERCLRSPGGKLFWTSNSTRNQHFSRGLREAASHTPVLRNSLQKVLQQSEGENQERGRCGIPEWNRLRGKWKHIPGQTLCVWQGCEAMTVAQGPGDMHSLNVSWLWNEDISPTRWCLPAAVGDDMDGNAYGNLVTAVHLVPISNELCIFLDVISDKLNLSHKKDEYKLQEKQKCTCRDPTE